MASGSVILENQVVSSAWCPGREPVTHTRKNHEWNLEPRPVLHRNWLGVPSRGLLRQGQVASMNFFQLCLRRSWLGIPTWGLLRQGSALHVFLEFGLPGLHRNRHSIPTRGLLRQGAAAVLEVNMNLHQLQQYMNL